MDWTKKRLIVIVGPTAVGKTAVAIRVAQALGTEIISADSRQVFRELNVGTAKPDEAELSMVKHHFINSHAIAEDYDAARFGVEGQARINALFENRDYVVVCGGSGLYIKALLEGFDEIPSIPEALREEIITKYETGGISWLQQQMAALDPGHFEHLDRNNPQRLMRALEVKLFTGRSIASFRTNSVTLHPYKIIKIGLDLPREILYERIDQRMDQMINKGLFAEAEALYRYKHHNALKTVGYQEIFDYMDGLYDRDEAIRLLKRNSRRYAKRQLTWFRRDPEIVWMNPANIGDIITTASA